MHSSTFVADLAVTLGVAAATGVLARLLRQPSILGYLLAGLLVGPYVPVPLFADPVRIQAIADFGVVLVMFAVGLELRITKLVRLLPVSGLTVLVEVSLLMWCGLTLGSLLGFRTVESTFLGAALAISSTMVVSKVYGEKRVTDDIRHHVLGILVVQDVVAIALIAATTGIAVSGQVSPEALVGTLVRLGAALIGMLGFGLLLVPRFVRSVVRIGSSEIVTVFAIGIAFVVARLAEALGFSLALGAFIAGVLVAESGRAHAVEERIRSVRDLFAAIFFVSIGMTVDPALVVANLPVALAVSSVVILGQLVSVSMTGILAGNGLKRSIVAGLSLGQIGEFSFIIAAIGVRAGVVREGLQAVVVSVAVITTFTTPLFVGKADRIVGWVDRLLPSRLRHLLSLHQEWVERFRWSSDVAEASPARRTLRAIGVDVLALLLLVALAGFFRKDVSELLSHRFSLAERWGRGLTAGTLVLLSIPILAALVGNSVTVARMVARSISEASASSAAARAAAHAVSVLVYLLVLVGVGVPVVAVLQPLGGGIYRVVLLLAAVLGVGFLLWWRAGDVESEVRSGVGKIASALAQNVKPNASELLSDPSLLPGLDVVVRITLAPTDGAVGRTLTELNLRAATGATVVAIHRENVDLLLPTGHERLEAGDVLALTGTEEALRQARRLLEKGTDEGSRD